MMLLAGTMARAKKTRTSTKTKSSRRRAPAKTRGRKPAAGRKTRPGRAASPGQSARIAQLEAENRRLREELEALRAERAETPLGEQSPTMDL